MSWAVEVRCDGEIVVTIEDRCLSGRDITEADADLIRDCAAHLLAFVGPKREGDSLMDWQPIETAPKGKVVLMFAVTDRHDDGRIANWQMATGWFSYPSGESLVWGGDRIVKPYQTRPTHWMPLPDPPKETT